MMSILAELFYKGFLINTKLFKKTIPVILNDLKEKSDQIDRC